MAGWGGGAVGAAGVAGAAGAKLKDLRCPTQRSQDHHILEVCKLVFTCTRAATKTAIPFSCSLNCQKFFSISDLHQICESVSPHEFNKTRVRETGKSKAEVRISWHKSQIQNGGVSNVRRPTIGKLNNRKISDT